MPNYNSASTIAEAIESVIAQEYKKELIIIDDNSTDKSIEIIKKYQSTHDFIKLIQMSSNKGPSFCRNIGIEKSSGEYIAFLDSDDYWLPEKISKQMSFMLNESLDYTYHDYYEIHHKESHRTFIERISPDEATPSTFPWKRGYGLCLTSIIKKSSIGEIRFPENKKNNTEDFYFFLQLINQGIYGKRFPHTLAAYNIFKNSRSSKKIKQAISVYKTITDINGTNAKSIYYFFLYVFNKIASQSEKSNKSIIKSI